MADGGFRRAVLIVGCANLTYFFVEFYSALQINSTALLADSADFLEDALVNFLIVAAVGWSVAARARLGMGLAALMLLPAAAFLWTAIGQLLDPRPPAPAALGLVGLGALAVNVGCAFLLAAHRRRGGSLARAAFLSARNDALANVAIILAAALTAAQPSIWPDLVVGLGVALLNLDAAREVYAAARKERATLPQP